MASAMCTATSEQVFSSLECRGEVAVSMALLCDEQNETSNFSEARPYVHLISIVGLSPYKAMALMLTHALSRTLEAFRLQTAQTLFGGA